MNKLKVQYEAPMNSESIKTGQQCGSLFVPDINTTDKTAGHLNHKHK